MIMLFQRFARAPHPLFSLFRFLDIKQCTEIICLLPQMMMEWTRFAMISGSRCKHERLRGWMWRNGKRAKKRLTHSIQLFCNALWFLYLSQRRSQSKCWFTIIKTSKQCFAGISTTLPHCNTPIESIRHTYRAMEIIHRIHLWIGLFNSVKPLWNNSIVKCSKYQMNSYPTQGYCCRCCWCCCCSKTSNSWLILDRPRYYSVVLYFVPHTLQSIDSVFSISQ